MLSAQDNDLLTRVGPGTPMGELFRRFWLPALLSDEIEAPDSPPVRLRILCEDLLAFRDSDGKVGIVDPYCSHRGAPLFFGRNEDRGIRCPYHGWKFNAQGACVDVPNDEVARDRPRAWAKLGIRAYPTKEAGGVVWIYMGPAQAQPELPALEWTTVPSTHRHVSRWLQRSNWLQGAEGEIDTSHISFLHKDLDPAQSKIGATGANLAIDGAPEITIRESSSGFSSTARRRFGNEYFWRVSQWLLPMYSLIPRAPGAAFTGSGGRAWVPIDDYHTTTFAYSFRIDQPLTDAELDLIASGAHFPPRTTRSSVQLAQGHPIDTFVPDANMGNDYLLDRAVQKTSSYTGIPGVSAQDRSVNEGMRPASDATRGIVDRTHEHLTRSDAAIVTARRRLMKLARDLGNGIEPLEAVRGASYAVRAISKICPIADSNAFFKEFGPETIAGNANTGGTQFASEEQK